MVGSRTACAAAIGLLLAVALAERASAGIGFPCTLGTASPTGFQPCTACAPGTFAPFFGATQCTTCPAGTATTATGAFVCSDCNCDDRVACTLDVCDATTAQCSAEPVPSCELIHMELAGTVESSFFPAVTVGMPIAGSYDVDPLAPDDAPLDPDFGSYDIAARSFELRVGQPPVLTAVDSDGGIGVFDELATPLDGYGVSFSTFDVTAPDGVEGDFINISLQGDDAFEDDTLIVAPSLASFPSRTMVIVLVMDDDDATIRSSDITLTAPEPGKAAASFAAIALLALHARRREGFAQWIWRGPDQSCPKKEKE